MNRLTRVVAVLLFGFTVLACPAYGQDWSVFAHVTYVVPTSAGSLSTAGAGTPAVYLSIDANAGGCSVGDGSFFYIAARYFGTDPYGNTFSATVEANKQLANTRAILSGLQLSMALGTKVFILGYNRVGNYCQIMDIGFYGTP